MYNGQGEPLFPQFVPSPLPGPSPVAEGVQGTSRGAAGWFSRLGDYLQRRVEVTSCSASQTATGMPQQWPAGSSSSSPMARPGTSAEGRAPSVSSGGATAEAVQAEVAPQLEVALGVEIQRLNVERMRTEEARAEARRLRGQLEAQESRMTMGPEALRLRALPEQHRGNEGGPGIPPEVPADLPPLGPPSTRALQDLVPLVIQNRFGTLST